MGTVLCGELELVYVISVSSTALIPEGSFYQIWVILGQLMVHQLFL